MRNVLAWASAILAVCVPAIAQTQGKLRITTASPLPNGTDGAYYVQQLAAAGGTPPYVWSEVISACPGLSLNTNGVLSGKLQANGDFSFTAQVTDAAGAIAFKVFAMTANPAPLAISTMPPLATAVKGLAYSQPFTSIGGTEPITWSAQGAIPTGLTFSSTGVLSGVPTVSGSGTFGVTATDSKGVKAVAAFQLQVAAPGPPPVLTPGSLSFTASASGSSPAVQSISVSPSISSVLTYTASADVPWITVTPASGTMPGAFDVGINQGSMPAGSYSGNVIISSPSLDSRVPVLLTPVPVALTLTDQPPALKILPETLSLFRAAKTTSTLTTTLLLRNTGSGPVDYHVTLVDLPSATVTPTSGTVAPNKHAALSLTLNIPPLQPGFYRGRIQIDWDGGSVSTLLKLFVGAKPKILVSGQGSTFFAVNGAGLIGSAPQSFGLIATGSVKYTIQNLDNPSWLTVNTTSGTANPSSPDFIGYSLNPAGLKSGSYYARIRVAAPDAANAPIDYVIVLNVIPTGQNPTVLLAPGGLLFIAGSSRPPSQNISVFSNTAGAVPYAISTSTDDGGTWLSATVQSGTASAVNPGRIQVSVDPSKLKPGVYSGRVKASAGAPIVRGARVTLIVQPSSSGAAASGATSQLGPAAEPAATCVPSALAISQTALQDSFQVFAHWPWFISTYVVDDCGNPISNATVVARFSNGDPDLTLDLKNPQTGQYSDNWYPDHSSAHAVVTITAGAPGLTTAITTIGGETDDNSAPAVRDDGPLHIFNPRTGDPLAPGTIIQLYGSGLSSPGTTPVVAIGGLPAQILYSASGQINAQIPLELDPSHEYFLTVAVGSAYTAPATMVTAPLTPGIAALVDGEVIAQHANYSLVTATSPAQPCEAVQTYLAGLGTFNQPLQTGDPAPSSPLATVTNPPTVKVNGVNASVLFAGLTPGLYGLYQINFIVPKDTPSGDQELEITQSGVVANTSLLSVGSQSQCK